MTDRVSKRTGPAATQKGRRAGRRETVRDEDIPRSGTEDVQATTTSEQVRGSSAAGERETGVADVVNNIMQAQKKRHSIAQSSIRKTHKQTVSDTEMEVAKLFDEHEENASHAHLAHLRRLQALLKQKAEIEATMNKRVARMQSAYAMYAELLQGVSEQRARQLDYRR